MDMNFIIAQVFGFLGIVANVSSMQFKRRKQILVALLFLNLFSALNFVFLGTWSSTYISFFAVLEMIINYLFERKKKPVPKVLVAIYILINILLGMLTFTGPLDIVPIICAIIFCITILLKNEQHIRLAMFINQCFWLVYDVSVGAYMFAVSNVLTMISISIAIYRYNRKPKKKKTVKKKV